MSVFWVFKSSKWVVNCSKQSQKVLENQEFPGFDSVLPWQTNKIFVIAVILSEYSGRSAKRDLYIAQLYHGPGAVSTGDLQKLRDR